MEVPPDASQGEKKRRIKVFLEWHSSSSMIAAAAARDTHPVNDMRMREKSDSISQENIHLGCTEISARKEAPCPKLRNAD